MLSISSIVLLILDGKYFKAASVSVYYSGPEGRAMRQSPLHDTHVTADDADA